MAKIENNIGWCDITGNPGIGCRGCELGDDCYALNDTPARVLRAGAWPGHIGEKIETFGKDRTFVPTKKGLSDLRRLNKLSICNECHQVVNWTNGNRDRLGTMHQYKEVVSEDGETKKIEPCVGILRRIRFFADSNSDWMDWPVEILAQALDEIRLAPNVDVILLTKWPELFFERLQSILDMQSATGSLGNDQRFFHWIQDWLNGGPPQGVWILTSVLGNALDEKRIANVLKIPAAVCGLSCEPLWSKPSFNSTVNLAGFDWIIVGCDSSKHHKGWEDYEVNARFIIEAGRMAGISVYHKQMPVNGKVSLKLAEFPAKEFQGVQVAPLSKDSSM